MEQVYLGFFKVFLSLLNFDFISRDMKKAELIEYLKSKYREESDPFYKDELEKKIFHIITDIETNADFAKKLVLFKKNLGDKYDWKDIKKVMNYLIIDHNTTNIVLRYNKVNLWFLKVQYIIMVAMLLLTSVVVFIDNLNSKYGYFDFKILPYFCLVFVFNVIVFVLRSSTYTASIMKRHLELIGKTELLRSI